MASSLPYDPFQNNGSLPCLNTADNGQSQYHQQREVSKNNSTLELKQTEDLLASDLLQLSLEDRNRAFDDVHCVGEELNETPELVEKSLAAFDQAAKTSQNPIYEIAMNQNRAYVEDSAFRLAFLRANFHDVDQSVLQMMSFLQNKAKYFGQDKVAREIVLSDLTEEELILMSSGFIHIQEGTDRMGRPIVHFFDQKRRGHGIDTTLRVYYFVLWNLLVLPNKDNVQTKGVQGIVHASLSILDVSFLDYFKEAVVVFNSMPIRISLQHICHETSSRRENGSLLDGILSFVLRSLPEQTRVRSRMHSGSYMEMRYQL